MIKSELILVLWPLDRIYANHDCDFRQMGQFVKEWLTF